MHFFLIYFLNELLPVLSIGFINFFVFVLYERLLFTYLISQLLIYFFLLFDFLKRFDFFHCFLEIWLFYLFVLELDFPKIVFLGWNFIVRGKVRGFFWERLFNSLRWLNLTSWGVLLMVLWLSLFLTLLLCFMALLLLLKCSLLSLLKHTFKPRFFWLWSALHLIILVANLVGVE